MKLDVIAPAYVSRASFNNNSELVNWYIEMDPGGMYPTILVPSPGTTEFAAVGAYNRIRGLINYNGTCYGVADNKFFTIDSAGTVTIKGTLTSTASRIKMASITDQIMIVDGFSGYIFKISTDTLTEIADVDFPDGATSVTSMNGRFIVNVPNSERFQYSDLRDGTAWQAINYYSAESLQDEVVAVHYAGQVLLVLGEFTTEIWGADTSGTTNVLLNMPGTYIDYGCIAPNTVCQLENSVFWLTQNRYGQGEILQTIDFDTRIISTPRIVKEINSYTTISDAFAYVFQERGHKFYRLTFPTAGVTWDYDLTTEYWNKAASYYNLEDTRHISNCYTFCYGKHLVGSYTDGTVYEMSSAYHDDNGERIRRLWQYPLFPNTENRRTTVYNLEILMERGTALTTGQGSDPRIMFQFSRDGGHTWMNERWRSPNKVGEYYKRAFWANAGSGFMPYGRVTATDPIEWIIVGATASIQPEFKVE
jgi:hypothetical protein